MIESPTIADRGMMLALAVLHACLLDPSPGRREIAYELLLRLFKAENLEQVIELLPALCSKPGGGR